MLNDNIMFEKKEVWLRIVALEYELYDRNMSNDEFEREIRRIYLEETGKSLNADLTIMRSSDSSMIKRDDMSSYVGTAIHVKNKDSDINEVYIVSQGTQTTDDWSYNASSIFAGKGNSQYIDAGLFYDDVMERVTIKGDKVVSIGLSHSLGHNNNLKNRLVDGRFDYLMSVNGAQPTYYQLEESDPRFEEALIRKFNINPLDPDAIYSIPPDKLHDFTLDYYNNKGVTDNSIQLISTDDPLFWTSSTRGFVTFGNVQYIETNPNFPGLRDAFAKIPDEEAYRIQMFFVNYSDALKEGGVNAFLQEWVGIDMEVISGIDSASSIAKAYIFDFNRMLREVDKKLPHAIEDIGYILEHKEVIFNALVDGGYIDAALKEQAIQALEGLESDLKYIEQAISAHGSFINQLFRWTSPTGRVLVDGAMIADFVVFFKRVLSRVEVLQDLAEPLSVIKDGHGIEEMLNALGRQNKENGIWKSYTGVDLIYHKKTTGDGQIKVNISSALRMYQGGMNIIERKRYALQRYRMIYDEEFINDFQQRQRIVLNRISDMESNPSAYQHLLNIAMRQNFETVGSTLERIVVHDQFYNLTGMSVEHVTDAIEGAITEAENDLLHMRNKIEELFAEEETIANLFENK